MLHIPGVRLVPEGHLQLAPDVLAKGPDEVEQHCADEWGVWAVLWPGRWPGAPHIPQQVVLAFDSRRAAQQWVWEMLDQLGPEIGPRKRHKKPSSAAHVGLQVWLRRQLDRELRQFGDAEARRRTLGSKTTGLADSRKDIEADE